MRSYPMSNQEYDALRISSPSCRFEGVVRTGVDSILGIKTIVLKTKDGMISYFDRLELNIDGNHYSSLPVGTKVTIEIPEGITPPFNYYFDKAMKFVVEPDGHMKYDD